jgi:hypothetical protein
MANTWAFETNQIHAGQVADSTTHARAAALEGLVGALLVSSGQAADTIALLNIAEAGEHIVSSPSLYGGTDNLFHYTLPKLGITCPSWTIRMTPPPGAQRCCRTPKPSSAKRSSTPKTIFSTSIRSLHGNIGFLAKSDQLGAIVRDALGICAPPASLP